ncbi:MAG: TonB-dependent siderophore receptor [Nostoc sp.]|uniref:TonB-dependent siderophore receptor n=1 Tax=Nostoc sp. TaxID=1180 RepID=UPI002FF990D6
MVENVFGRYLVAPVLSWQISDRTKLTLEAEYLYAAQPFDQGIPAVGSVLPNPNGKISRSRYVGEPSDADIRQAYRIGYNLEHSFSKNWEVRSAFQGHFFLRNTPRHVYSVGVLDDRTISRTFQAANDYYNVYNLDNYIVGRFATGGIQHQLVTGFNISRTETLFSSFTRSTAPLDLFNPVYGQPLGSPTDPRKDLTTQDQLGIYIQDQITLAENLKLLLGGRFDIASQKGEDFIASTSSFQQDEAFSPRVGIVYQPIKPISLYASYSRGFEQDIGRSFDNTVFQPERTTQYEVGVKADLSERLSATLAFYDLTRSNVETTDPRNPDFSIQTGEQNSQGIELDVSGEILPGWNIFAGYAYTNATITKDNTFAVGNRLNNVPEHSLNLWTTYEIQSGNFKWLGLSLGLFYIGDACGELR